MFKKRTSRSYEKRAYKSAPKRYKSKTSRKLKSLYTREYKKPKAKRSDDINFKIPHEKMKPKKAAKTYSFNDMSKQAKQSLYTYKEKKPANHQASGIHFKKTSGVSLYHGNAQDDKVKKNDPRSKKRRRLARYRLFYLFAIAIGVIGLILSIYYTNTVPMILFIMLLICAVYGYLISRE